MLPVLGKINLCRLGRGGVLRGESSPPPPPLWLRACIVSKSSRFDKVKGNIIKDEKSLSRLKKEIDDTTIKNARNLFPLKKEIDDTTVKIIRNLFRLKKENKSIKNRIIRDIRNLSGH